MIMYVFPGVLEQIDEVKVVDGVEDWERKRLLNQTPKMNDGDHHLNIFGREM